MYTKLAVSQTRLRVLSLSYYCLYFLIFNHCFSLQDHFRQAGDVIFADVYRDGTGVIEFTRHEHMRRALRDLDNSKFRSHEVHTSQHNILLCGGSFHNLWCNQGNTRVSFKGAFFPSLCGMCQKFCYFQYGL